MLTFDNLHALTGRESGCIAYDDAFIICNWCTIKGLPRVFGGGLVGLAEELSFEPDDVSLVDNIASELEELPLLYDVNGDFPEQLHCDGKKYLIYVNGALAATVYTPKDWN